MQENSEVVQDLRLWLLGLLSQEEMESLEQRLLTDGDAFQEISIVEEELIDEYLSCELSDNERVGFESFFMNSPERQREFKIAKALRSYVEREDPFGRRDADPDIEHLPALAAQQTSFLSTLRVYQIPLIAAVSILAVTVVWIAFKFVPKAEGPSLAVLLEPAAHTREGGSVQEVSVPRGIQVLELQAKLPKREFKSYRATLLDADGNTVLTDEKPRVDTSGSETDVVVIPVPAERMVQGQYQLQVDAFHSDGRRESAVSYRFVVIPQS